MVKKRMYYNYPCYVTATDTALSSKKKVLKRVVCCESLLDAIEAVSVFRGKKVYSDIMVINHYPFYEAMSSVNVCVYRRRGGGMTYGLGNQLFKNY